jgi:hypothetical protein
MVQWWTFLNREMDERVRNEHGIQRSRYRDWLWAGRLRSQSSSSGRVKNFCSPRCPPNHLSNGYRGLFRRGLSDQCVKPTTHLQLVPSSRKHGSIDPLPHTPSWRTA